jgi:hypothetical protein
MGWFSLIVLTFNIPLNVVHCFLIFVEPRHGIHMLFFGLIVIVLLPLSFL